MHAFLAPESWPFLLATGLMLVIGVLELFLLLAGASASHWLDGVISHPDGVEGHADTLLGWLHIGRAPILALIVTLLAAFAVIGFGIQIVAAALAGALVPAWLAASVAFAGALPVVRVAGGWLARIVPREETTAVSDASLIGRTAIIVTGTAAAGRPAEARLRDEHGNPHYVMVEPEGLGVLFERGASVLLVRQIAGRRFHVIQNPMPELL